MANSAILFGRAKALRVVVVNYFNTQVAKLSASETCSVDAASCTLSVKITKTNAFGVVREIVYPYVVRI